MFNCPECNGRGAVVAVSLPNVIWHSDPDIEQPEITSFMTSMIYCRLCEGHGLVNKEIIDNIALGRAMRDDRLNNGISIFDAALNLGITPHALLLREHGYQMIPVSG